MVHKRFVRKNGKTFGPYYYESYREGNQIKKKYLGVDNTHKISLNKLVVLQIIVAFLLIFGLVLYLDRENLPFNNSISYLKEKVISGFVVESIDQHSSDSVTQSNDSNDQPNEENPVEQPISDEPTSNSSDQIIIIDNSTVEQADNFSVSELNDSNVSNENNFTIDLPVVNDSETNLNLSENISNNIEDILNETNNNSTESDNQTILDSNTSQALSIKTTRGKIRLGEPVKWIKNISLETPDNITIELPKEAENISVIDINDEAIASNVVISGNAISDIESNGFLTKIFRFFTGFAVENNVDNVDSVQVSINDSSTDYIIEYYTDAPVATEQNASNGKIVTISAPDELNYTDVLSYTNLSEDLNVGQENKLNVYWIENQTDVPFDAYDLDENSKLDYIEWITPHLSNQSFFISSGGSGENLSSDSGPNEWRMFGHDLNNTRFTTSDAPIRIGAGNFTNFTVGAGKRIASPAIANGYLYVTVDDGLFYQLNASNISQQIANFTTGFNNVISPSPAIANEFTYISAGGIFYQLNASNISQQIANFTTTSQFSPNSPVIANGYLYLGVNFNDGALYQLNASNISQQIANFSFSGGYLSAPAITNGYLYIGDSGYFHQLNASNISQEIAVYQGIFASSFLSNPAVSNGFVYVPTSNSISPAPFYQLNASNVSQQIANFTTGSTTTAASPAIANGFVYLQGSTELYQLNATNVSQKISNFSTGSTATDRSPAISNGYIFAGSDKKFFELNASNISQLISNFTLPGAESSATVAFGARFSGPAISNGYLYIGSGNTLFQFGLNPLQVIIRSPTNKTYGGPEFPLRFNVTLNGAGNVRYTLNNGINNFTMSSTDNINFNASNASLPDGSYTFRVFANDSIGSTNNTEFVVFSVDRTPPRVNISNPRNITYGSTGFPIEFNVSLNENATNVRYTLNNGINNVSMAVSNVLNWTGSNASLPDGSYTFRVFANDSIGNINSTETITFSVDSHKPQVNIITPIQSSIINTSSFPINITLDEAGYCEYSLNGGKTNISLTNTANISFIGNGIPLHNNVVLNAYCNDSAGNRNDSVTVSFTSLSHPTLNSDSGSNDWRMYNRFLNLTGYGSSFNGFINKTNLTIFQIKTGNIQQVLISSSTNSLYYNNNTGSLNQLNASNLSQVLSSNNDFIFNQVNSKLIIAGDYLYSAHSTGTTQLNASNLSQVISNRSSFCNNPLVYDSYVYADCGDFLSKLDANNISDTISFTFNYFSFFYPIAIANDNIYAQVNDEKLVQVNISNLDQEYAQFGGFEPSLGFTNIVVNTPPTYSNGFVYVGSTPTGAEQTTKLYQLNASNITNIISEFNITANNGLAGNTIAVGNGYAYLTSNIEGVLYQLNATNLSQLITTFTGTTSMSLNPTINDDSLFIADTNVVYQLNATNVSQIISQYTNSSESGFSSLSIALGNVYTTGLTTGNLYVFGGNSGSDTTNPRVTIINPTATTYSVNSYDVNISLNEAGYCEYSLDAGVTNNSLTQISSTKFGDIRSSVSNGNYVLNAYCNDTAGNRNDTESVSFSVSVSSGGSGGGGGGGGSGGGGSGTPPGNNGTGPGNNPVDPPYNYTSCIPVYSCGGWSACDGSFERRTCTDSICGNSLKIESRACSFNCNSNFICGEWSECNYVSNTNDVIKGNVALYGNQERKCIDINSCVSEYKEDRACNDKVNISFVLQSICGKESLILVDSLSNNPVSRVDLESAKENRLNIAFIQNNSVYCSTCYDNVQNGDEQGVDCGGSCNACSIAGKKYTSYLLLILWLASFVLLVIILFLMREDKITRIRHLIVSGNKAVKDNRKNDALKIYSKIRLIYQTLPIKKRGLIYLEILRYHQSIK